MVHDDNREATSLDLSVCERALEIRENCYVLVCGGYASC